jgi:hypothetical protein
VAPPFSFPTFTNRSPLWLIALLPGVYWPSRWENVEGFELNLETKPIRLVNPHQTISRVMNNLVLLLSFGLCSPALCCSITLNVCVHLGCWLLLIDRFVHLRIHTHAIHPPHLIVSDKRGEDQLLLLLDRQLHGVNCSLLVCKWPIILTSCVFLTLLGWDMAGDQGGWLQALWVPIVGVAMVSAIGIWDQVLISDRIPAQGCSFSSFSFFFPSSRNSKSVDVCSLEFAHSSLHQRPGKGSLDLERVLEKGANGSASFDPE